MNLSDHYIHHLSLAALSFFRAAKRHDKYFEEVALCAVLEAEYLAHGICVFGDIPASSVGKVQRRRAEQLKVGEFCPWSCCLSFFPASKTTSAPIPRLRGAGGVLENPILKDYWRELWALRRRHKLGGDETGQCLQGNEQERRATALAHLYSLQQVSPPVNLDNLLRRFKLPADNKDASIDSIVWAISQARSMRGTVRSI